MTRCGKPELQPLGLHNAHCTVIKSASPLQKKEKTLNHKSKKNKKTITKFQQQIPEKVNLMQS